MESRKHDGVSVENSERQAPTPLRELYFDSIRRFDSTWHFSALYTRPTACVYVCVRPSLESQLFNIKIVWLILWVLIEKCIFSLTQKIHVVTEESFRNYWFNYTKLRLINGYFTIPLPLTIIPLTFHEFYLLWSTYLLTVI